MKVEVSEGDYGLSIQLIPETVHETNILLRSSMNASSEKPSIYYHIPSSKNECSSSESFCSIWIKKRKLNAQKLSINNERQADVKGRITKSKKKQ